LVREARHLAVDRGQSLSALIATLLQEQLGSRQRYSAARERQLSLLEKGFDLGTGGQISWTRDELHER
jgi:uncharacterized protein involved in exopolysaccharide biosynthesis